MNTITANTNNEIMAINNRARAFDGVKMTVNFLRGGAVIERQVFKTFKDFNNYMFDMYGNNPAITFEVFYSDTPNALI